MADKQDSEQFTDEEVGALNFSDWPIPDEYALEVGRLMGLWSSLENFLDRCIGKLAGFNDLVDPTVLIFTLHSSFPQRLDIFQSLCERLAPEFPNLAPFKDVARSIKAAQASRNRFAHNGMVLNSDSDAVEMNVASARGKLKLEVKTVKLAEIRRASMQTHEAMMDLYKLVLQKDYGPRWRRQ
jgi:hypothetical protein